MEGTKGWDHRMRWPWQKVEQRDSGGDFSDAVVRLIEAQAAGTAADASSTAAVEAASGALSRAFAAAVVEAEPWAREAVTPVVLGQIGRDLVRSGDSLHVIQVVGGKVQLIPCSSWHWEGNHDPDSWTVRASAYGPSTSTTWHLPNSGVVFVMWGSTPGQPYVGVGPTSWAHTTARLQSEAEKALADESAGAIGNLIPMPQNPDGGDEDPYRTLRTDLSTGRGKAHFVEFTWSGAPDGRSSAPQSDWKPNRLGPNPTATQALIAQQSFERTLASCGVPPSLFIDSDGTSQREGVRRWHLGTVIPLADLVAHELTAKLETPVRLRFDNYPTDLAGRAQAFAKLVAGGMDLERALAISGLLADD